MLKNHEHVKSHIAWKGGLQEHQAEMLLQGQPPFSYVLRDGKEAYTYFITFVKDDGTFKHQRFVLEADRKGWHYRNGQASSHPVEVLADTVEEIIPMMMHCEPGECRPLV
jgi:hypothetical protein